MTGGLHRLAQTVGALQKDTSQAIDVRSWAGMERSENSGKTDEKLMKTDEQLMNTDVKRRSPGVCEKR